VTPFPKFFAWVGYAVVCAIVIAALLEGAGFVFFKLGRRADRNSFLDRCPCYAGQPWGKELRAEEVSRNTPHGRYVPFRLWGSIVVNGKHVNVDETPLGPVRRTVNHAKDVCRGARSSQVWVLGGSTVFGTGVPDWGTVPSYLSAALNAREGCFEVANLGVEGYASNQEVLLLAELLKRGARPDQVFLYDGINDAFVGAVGSGAATHIAFDRVKMRVEDRIDNRLRFINESYAMNLIESIFRHSSADPSSGEAKRKLDERARATLDNYLANVRMVRGLADAFHFVPHFFWQPAAYAGTKPFSPYETEVTNGADLPVSERQAFRSGVAAVYAEAERRTALTKDFTYLGHVFDAVKDSLYLDSWMHLCPRGNEIVAGAMAESLAENSPNP
jgi:lysophospholipase L1-like esterase